LEGSIEFCKKYTNPDNHFYLYDPISEKVNDELDYEPNSVLYMAFDSLPCELARDSSDYCSS